MRGCLLTVMLLGCSVSSAPQHIAQSAPLDAGTLSDAHWYDRYVADSCSRCPECCVTIPQAPPPKRKQAKTVTRQIVQQRRQVRALRLQIKEIRKRLKRKGSKNGNN
jgi:hypothetical protein